jgi:histidine triad (HIT) family protein
MLRHFALRIFSHLALLRHKMDPTCIFCKIIAEESPAEIVYKDEQATAFRDKHPVAQTHVLIVPNKHIQSVNEAEPEDEALLGHLFTVARKIAEMNGVAADGYRLIVNTGAHGGQTVFHLHIHIIAGKRLRFSLG